MADAIANKNGLAKSLQNIVDPVLRPQTYANLRFRSCVCKVLVRVPQ